ncbi:MAG: HlyD family secretion protein [Proteobacteria bacterium]|nr:HlyD family secretion protein [Pseudomonadota bacterium]
MDQTVNPPVIGEAQSRPGWASSRRPFFFRPRVVAVAAVVLLGVAYGAYETYLRFTHIYEYDARATADIVTVSSRADGWVVDMPALEGAHVGQGDVVVKIDDRASRLKVDALKAQIEGIRTERSRLKAERIYTREQVETAVKTRTSGVAVREKAREALQSDLDFAKIELDRTKKLYATQVANERQLQTAQAAVNKLEFQILQLEAEYQQAEGSLDEAKAGEQRLKVIDAQIEALTHQVANLAAQMHQQQVDVEDRTIKSPIPAVIDRTFVLPGEYVAAGQRILMLHNPAEVWVEANIKETQVGSVKLGQPVHVSVDAYPGLAFEGKVTRIGSATTARFALLPTPNPSGNFTKITQRVPVKIDIANPPKPLTPGMMVEVEIDVR